ncbi:MAG: ferrous iron transport protein A [Defluviitaleaceae bacterium]|nr:ferrous iron transport protein A [Defluviitaleaceae bacterium]
MNLYAAGKSGAFRITSVPKISLLEGMGLRRGTNVTVQNRYIFGGPVLLRVEGAYSVAVGKDVAMQIGVERVNPQ